jgi:DNA-binding NtrC family response regulator
MTRLLHDRYVMFDEARGCDLVSGREITLDALPPEDSPLEGESCELGLSEVLAHGRDGEPRWLVIDARNGIQATAIARRAAQVARRSGFVAMAVEMYLRLCDVLTTDLAERTLLLIGGFASALPRARAAFIEASARAPRAHVLLTFRSAADRGRASVVREARATYGVARAAAGIRPGGAELARYVDDIARAEEFALAGRHAAGDRLLRKTAAALARRRAFTLSSQALTTLGRMLLERGRSGDADIVFNDAAREGSSGGDEACTVKARIWQASARCDCERFTEAESLCRATLVAGSLSSGTRRWAEAMLLRVFLWQARFVADPSTPAALTGDERQELGEFVSAFVDDVAVRASLAAGRVFEAGQRAGQATACADASGNPLARAVAHMAALRVRCAAGDLGAARQSFEAIHQAARQAHAPLRVARARLVWHDALRRSGRSREAATELACLARIRGAAPPLLGRAIDRRVAGRDIPSSNVLIMPTTVSATSASSLIHVAHEQDDDRTAVRLVLERVGREIQATRIDLVSADGGPVTTVLSIGSGMATHLGARVLDAGIVIGPEIHQGGHEIGTPVRLGSRLLAGVVARWPLDRAPGLHAADALGLASAVLAPRIDAQLASARLVAEASTSAPELVGVSAAMEEVRRAIVRAARSPFNVLIEGESGSGKELAARAIHQLSARRERRFCDVNCAAIPEELLDSELFGHARGAFTGAVTERAGLFEEANGGTLFLDEIADLSARGQAKLLRVLQQHEVRRVGESFSRKIDVRLVTAANREMRTEAAEGRFRQDLLYRLDVIRIRVPPLRDRPEDVAVLAEHFWRDAAMRVGSTARLTHGVLSDLTRYHWPGNVRELQNVIAALAVAAPPRGRVRPALLPPALTSATSVTAVRFTEARAQFERRCIEVALARAGGNRSKAAAQLGLSRQGLLKMIARLGIGR